MASWLVRSTPDRVVRVRALAGDIVLCSQARHSTQVHKWVPANLMPGGNHPAMDWHSIQWGVEILLVASCYRNRWATWLVSRLYLYLSFKRAIAPEGKEGGTGVGDEGKGARCEFW